MHTTKSINIYPEYNYRVKQGSVDKGHINSGNAVIKHPKAKQNLTSTDYERLVEKFKASMQIEWLVI